MARPVPAHFRWSQICLLFLGGDDRRVLLWNVEKAMVDREEPQVMLKQHLSNIFCLSFDSKNTRIFSGGNDDMAIVHDIETWVNAKHFASEMIVLTWLFLSLSGDCVDVFYHTKPVYGLGVDPSNDNIFATAGEDGRVLLFDMRASNDEPSVVVKYRAPFHSVMFHPVDDHFMITANAKEGAALWDNRAQRMPVIRYGGEDAAQSCMSVRFNSMGTLLLALRRRLPPILYSTLHQEPICQFYNQDYYNSCTMKSCTFAGATDEYVLSGSDDFNLYVWKVSDADRKFYSRCSQAPIIIFTRFSRKATSVGGQKPDGPLRPSLYCESSSIQFTKVCAGIIRCRKDNQSKTQEQFRSKLIKLTKCFFVSLKLWTPFELENWTGSLTEETQTEPVREVFTHDEYISLVHVNGQVHPFRLKLLSWKCLTNPLWPLQNMTHDYSNQNTHEDPRMIAFFDYLVQQEIEGWSSESSNQTSDHTSENSSRPDSPTSDTEPTHFTTVKAPPSRHRELIENIKTSPNVNLIPFDRNNAPRWIKPTSQISEPNRLPHRNQAENSQTPGLEASHSHTGTKNEKQIRPASNETCCVKRGWKKTLR